MARWEIKHLRTYVDRNLFAQPELLKDFSHTLYNWTNNISWLVIERHFSAVFISTSFNRTSEVYLIENMVLAMDILIHMGRRVECEYGQMPINVLCN